jgi:5,10-methylenetetrahydrofolate reductase, prokaryotic form
MRIIEMFKNKKPLIAFEIFPPRQDVPLDTIYEHLDQFAELKPDYMSVTYGAGGSQKGRTLEIASRIKHSYGIESMAHFTCVGHSKEEIDSMLAAMHEKGLENVLALRGDPPANQTDFDFNKNIYCYAYELVGHIRKVNNFCIAAAAYTEGHVDCKRMKDDIIALKQKVDAGVDFLITQLFFDNRLFYDFVDRLRALDINCPVSAGVMPIFKADQIKSITAKSGCSIPAKLVLMMDKYQDNPDDLRKAGIEYAALQIRDLIESGADGIHLYTMNRPKSTKEILEGAGLL